MTPGLPKLIYHSYIHPTGRICGNQDQEWLGTHDQAHLGKPLPSQVAIVGNPRHQSVIQASLGFPWCSLPSILFREDAYPWESTSPCPSRSKSSAPSHQYCPRRMIVCGNLFPQLPCPPGYPLGGSTTYISFIYFILLT